MTRPSRGRKFAWVGLAAVSLLFVGSLFRDRVVPSAGVPSAVVPVPALAPAAATSSAMAAAPVSEAASASSVGSATATLPLPGGPPASPAAASAAPERLVFERGSDRLPAGSMEALGRVADAARANVATTVQISAYYPGGAASAAGAKLASRRADATRHALEADGVSAARLQIGLVEAAAADGASVEMKIR